MVHGVNVTWLLIAKRIIEIMRVAIQTEFAVLGLSIDEAEVTDVMFCDVELLAIGLVFVFTHARLQSFSVDKDELLRKIRQIAGDNSVARCDHTFLHAERFRFLEHLFLAELIS